MNSGQRNSWVVGDHRLGRESASEVEVSEEDFLRVWCESGGSEEAGRLHLGITRTLRSSVLIGGTMYRLAADS